MTSGHSANAVSGLVTMAAGAASPETITLNDLISALNEPVSRQPAPHANFASAGINALTIDVEDYFQVSAFAGAIRPDHWDRHACRVERNIDRLLALLDQHQARATFFTLGWIAERYPMMVRRIVAAGHELASHGYGHQRASDQSRKEFFADIDRAKQLLESIGGFAVRGYRAPSFSITPQNLWAFDCLLEAGYSYSSSVYPVKHDHYGMPDAPRFPFLATPGLVEIPITTIAALGRNWPAGGGGFFRLLPYPVSRWLIQRFNKQENQPAIFYFHPWEIDADQPRIAKVSAKSRFRHYLNLSRTEARLAQLLQDFRWDRMDRVFETDASTAQGLLGWTRPADLQLNLEPITQPISQPVMQPEARQKLPGSTTPI